MRHAILALVLALVGSASCRCRSDTPTSSRPLALLESQCPCCACDAPVVELDATPDAPVDAGVPCSPGVHLVVIERQSNAQGRDYATNLDEPRRTELSTPFAAVPMAQWISTSPPPAGQSIVWKSRPFEPTQPRLVNMGGTNPGAMGIELSLARVLDAACPGQFALVKVSIGGTGWRAHWAPDAAFPTVGDNLHTQYMQFVASAKASIGAVDVVARVPIGGEFDTNNAVDAADVGEQMLASDNAFRAVYPDTLDVFPQLGINAITGPHKGTVRTEQAGYASSCTRCAMVTTDDLGDSTHDGTYVDNVHYRAKVYDQLGVRVGNAIISNM